MSDIDNESIKAAKVNEEKERAIKELNATADKLLEVGNKLKSKGEQLQSKGEELQAIGAEKFKKEFKNRVIILGSICLAIAVCCILVFIGYLGIELGIR